MVGKTRWQQESHRQKVRLRTIEGKEKRKIRSKMVSQPTRELHISSPRHLSRDQHGGTKIVGSRKEEVRRKKGRENNTTGEGKEIRKMRDVFWGGCVGWFWGAVKKDGARRGPLSANKGLQRSAQGGLLSTINGDRRGAAT